MCGIWGAVIHDPEAAKADLVKAATEADRRGSHAWGIARIDDLGGLSIERHIGGYLGTPVAPAPFMIGNHRLATSGMTQDWKDRDVNQPVSVGHYAVSHNGIVLNVDQIRYRCDSAFIAERIANETGDLRHRVEAAFAVIRSDGPHAACVLSPEGVVVFRQGSVGISPHPLWRHDRSWGILVVSRPIDQTAHPIPIGASWLR